MSNPVWLRTAPTKGLAKRSARSGALTASAQLVNALVGAVSTIILARLLTPEAFGIFAMVISFQFLIGALRDLGVGQALVQREDLDQRHVHGVFWWSTIAAVANILLFSAAAPALAWFYGEQRVLMLAVVFGGVGALTALGAVPRALLVRAMRFGAIGGIEVGAAVLGHAAAIFAAMSGAGYWALMVQAIVSALAALIGVLYFSRYRPDSPGGLLYAKPLVSFGVKATGATMLQSMVRNCDNIIIGRTSGDAALGQYSIAYRLLLMPIRQVNGPLVRVAIPALSRLQSDQKRYRAFYIRAVKVSTFIGMPGVGMLFLTSPVLIPLLLGPGWDGPGGAVELFQILAIPAFFGTFNFATGVAFVTCDAVGKQLRWAIFSGVLTVTGFLIGSQWGAVGVAQSYALTVLVLRPIGILYCSLWTIPTAHDVFRAVSRSAVASVVPVLAFSLLSVHLSLPTIPWMHVVLLGMLYVGAYLILWCGLPGGRRAMSEVIEVVKLTRREGSADNIGGEG